jgi:peroxiredoxin
VIRVQSLNKPDAPEAYAVATPAGYADKLVTGTEPEAKGLLAVGSAAPDWTLTDPEGRPHSLKDYRGKVVVLDFWGTWCVPCQKTMPALQRLHEKFKDRGVVILGIAVGDREGDPAGFMKRQGFSYGLLLRGDDVATAYQAVVLPTVYVIGADGKIVHAEFGFREKAEEGLTAVLERHLKPGAR